MMILIADAHEASASINEAEFKQMLEAISGTDMDVMFLGDIMDLWVAKDGYEDELQNWFKSWCVQEKERRRIIYVEGNHEFFVARRYNGVLGEFQEKRYVTAKALFEHGHNIQERPTGFNRLFIGLCKSWFANLVLSVMPCGRAFAQKVKKSFGSNGRVFPGRIPEDRVRLWAESTARKTGVSDLFIGHFHRLREMELPGGAVCHVLPPWKNKGEIMLFDEERRAVSTGVWRELLLGAK